MSAPTPTLEACRTATLGYRRCRRHSQGLGRKILVLVWTLGVSGAYGAAGHHNFRNANVLYRLVRFEGDQVLGIRLCIVIRNKNLGIAYVVDR